MHSASLEQGPEEYMEIPFASAKNITAWNLPLPVINVPLFTVDDSGNLKYEKTDTPYLVTPRSHSRPYTSIKDTISCTVSVRRRQTKL